MGRMGNSVETQPLGLASKSGLEIKNGKSSAKDGMPERLRFETIQKEVRYCS